MPESYIAIYSCYENPNTTSFRTLEIKDKDSNEEFSIPMNHNSVILFSVETNSKYLHRIVLNDTLESNWIGITYRFSQTFVKFNNKIPILANGKTLTLASDEEEKEFYKLKSQENRSIKFQYPEINYTISPSDLMDII